MRKIFRSLGVRVFCLTTLAIALSLVLFIVLQSIFYERIYLSEQRKELNNSVQAIQATITDITDVAKIKQALSKATYGSDVYMMVYDNDKPIMASYELHVSVPGDKEYVFPLDTAISDDDLYNLKLSKGTKVTVSYIEPQNGGFAILKSIKTSDGIWQDKEKHFGDGGSIGNPPKNAEGFSPPPKPSNRLNGELQSIEGTVTLVILPSVDLRNNDIRHDAMDALFDWVNNASKDDTSYTYKSLSTNCSYLVASKKVNDNRYIFAIISLKSVNDAVSVMRSMLKNWIIICILVGLLVAFHFSKLVAKPISDITKVTTKIKDLDFSDKCKVKGHDELGMLAQNINDMSDELNNNITELKKANIQLQKDIEHEHVLERQRRDFVAAASHELKTPLAIIRAYSEGLLDGVSEQKREKYLNVIVDETKKMDALVLDMLENAKLEAGKDELNLEQTALSDLFNEYKELFNEAALKRNIKIGTQIEQNVKIRCDKEKIARVIENFMSNALKNTPSDGEIILNLTDTDEYVALSVENTGSHIPDEDLENVWDRFYKVDKARDRSLGGTGLGLSIAKNILVLHNADYYVTNTDQGVMFGFKLPKNM